MSLWAERILGAFFRWIGTGVLPSELGLCVREIFCTTQERVGRKQKASERTARCLAYARQFAVNLDELIGEYLRHVCYGTTCEKLEIILIDRSHSRFEWLSYAKTQIAC
jgi:hypothetical protein